MKYARLRGANRNAGGCGDLNQSQTIAEIEDCRHTVFYGQEVQRLVYSKSKLATRRLGGFRNIFKTARSGTLTLFPANAVSTLAMQYTKRPSRKLGWLG
jgi:hypothetical protein